MNHCKCYARVVQPACQKRCFTGHPLLKKILRISYAYEQLVFEAPFQTTKLCAVPFTPLPPPIPPPSLSRISSALLGDCSHASRYLYPYDAIYSVEILVAHWDSDIGTAGDVAFELWVETVSTGELVLGSVFDYVSTITYT